MLEECDSANEWYFDHATKKLYFNFNGTGGPSGDLEWVATSTRVLFNITGTKTAPAKDISIRGVEIRDTRITYLDPHGMPSGGDWAIQRTGAIVLEGSEGFVLDSCFVTRIDGNGVFLNGYNRNASIRNNEFGWVGASAIASWGYTGTCLNENCSLTVPYGVGPDAREYNLPRYTSIEGNLVYELGIWQKQSSMYFHAISIQAHMKGNIFFNGPRAAVNLNDGCGGGDLFEHNLLIK